MLARVAKETGGDFSDSVVILDPPRKGTMRALIEEIAQNGVPKVVYISCNPDTLARDCVIFKENGYSIGEVTPVDLFPRTGHVETIVLLDKKRVDGYINIDLDVDMFESKGVRATYAEIKD